MIWLFLACTSSPVLDGADDGPFHGAAPRITDVDVACDTDEAEWTFEVIPRTGRVAADADGEGRGQR